MENLKLGQQINAGNFIVSVGAFKIEEVAICSKSSGKFVKLKQVNRSKKLRTIKRKFKTWINNDESFCFSNIQKDNVKDIINILNK